MAIRDRDPGKDPLPGDIYFEWYQVGAYLKLSAIDADTGVEVSVMGPGNVDKTQLQQTALRKLRTQLAKRKASPWTGL